MNKLIRHSIAVGLALGMATTVYASDDMKMDMNASGHMKIGMDMGVGTNANPAMPSTTVDAVLVDGTIQKVDRETGMVTIEHGELKNVGMPAMTMAYKAKDAAMLKHAKEGEKVKFRLENLNGVYTITTLKKR